MKPNLPAPPADMFGFRAVIASEEEIDQELLDRYEFAEKCPPMGVGTDEVWWSLYRRPRADEGVPIPGTKGMTLPGDHQKHDLEKLL